MDLVLLFVVLGKLFNMGRAGLLTKQTNKPQNKKGKSNSYFLPLASIPLQPYSAQLVAIFPAGTT